MKQVPLQRRQHPIFSPVALISTLVLMGGLTVSLVFTGGRAFSPGPLSAQSFSGVPVQGVLSHADIGDECAQCHAPFQGVDAQRCEGCHEQVKQERENGESTHGRFPNANRCAECHTEHQGADYDLLSSALKDFDHSLTSFSLARHIRDYEQLPIRCEGCHVNGRDFTPNSAACDECHRAANMEFVAAHVGQYDANCLACHDGHDTLADMTDVEHAQFFELLGQHATAPCAGCHFGSDFTNVAQECLTCHAEPAAHLGLFGTACVDCHTPVGWQPALLQEGVFDHASSTRFSLETHQVNYDGNEFTCATCHTAKDAAAPFQFKETECSDCHVQFQADFTQSHAAEVGSNCLGCHDGTGRMTNFDHSTVWPLVGQHAATECAACHVNQVFSGTPRECVACHAEPAIHAGLFGTDCAACHTAAAWAPAQLRQHTFPLNHGGEGEIACGTCHTNTYTAYTCTNCHAHDPAETAAEHLEEGISGSELAVCAACHPTGREDEAEFED